MNLEMNKSLMSSADIELNKKRRSNERPVEDYEDDEDEDDDYDDDEEDEYDDEKLIHHTSKSLSNGKKKKTKGRVKIKMEFIENKNRRYTTFSKRKTGIMKKAYELSTLTGTQVMLLVASETGHVYTFATDRLQPMITSEDGKRLIQKCLSPMNEFNSNENNEIDDDPHATHNHHQNDRISIQNYTFDQNGDYSHNEEGEKVTVGESELVESDYANSVASSSFSHNYQDDGQMTNEIPAVTETPYQYVTNQPERGKRKSSDQTGSKKSKKLNQLIEEQQASLNRSKQTITSRTILTHPTGILAPTTGLVTTPALFTVNQSVNIIQSTSFASASTAPSSSSASSSSSSSLRFNIP